MDDNILTHTHTHTLLQPIQLNKQANTTHNAIQHNHTLTYYSCKLQKKCKSLPKRMIFKMDLSLQDTVECYGGTLEAHDGISMKWIRSEFEVQWKQKVQDI